MPPRAPFRLARAGSGSKGRRSRRRARQACAFGLRARCPVPRGPERELSGRRRSKPSRPGPARNSGPWSLTRAPGIGHSGLTATGDGSGPQGRRDPCQQATCRTRPRRGRGDSRTPTGGPEVVTPDRRGPDDFRVSRGLATCRAVVRRGLGAAAVPPVFLLVCRPSSRCRPQLRDSSGTSAPSRAGRQRRGFPHVDERIAPS